MKKFPLPELLQMVHLLFKLHPLFEIPVETQHGNINMNQYSSINSITKVQNITQAITNTDLPPISKLPDEIAKAIIDLTSELKSEKSGVNISSIIMRADKPELNKKRSEVNHHMKEMCNRKNFYFIDHSKKIKARHLNSSRLHLNRKGANILSCSLTQHISNVFN